MSLNQVLGGGGGGKKTVANYHKTAIQNSLLQWQNKNNVVATGDTGTFQENLSPLDENVDGDFAGVCQHKDGSLIGRYALAYFCHVFSSFLFFNSLFTVFL